MAIRIITVSNTKPGFVQALEAEVNAFEARDDVVVIGHEFVMSQSQSDGGGLSERLAVIVTYQPVAADRPEPRTLARSEQACNVDGEVFRTDSALLALLSPLADDELAICPEHIARMRSAARVSDGAMAAGR
jgi:hypothetical protein